MNLQNILVKSLNNYGYSQRYKNIQINMKPLLFRPGINYYEKKTQNISVEETNIQE